MTGKNRPIKPMTKHDKPLTHHKKTAHITRPDSGINSKGSTQTYGIYLMGKTTSKKGVSQQKAHTRRLASQTVMFTLLKCPASHHTKKTKLLQFSSHIFPMKTIIAQNVNYC